MVANNAKEQANIKYVNIKTAWRVARDANNATEKANVNNTLMFVKVQGSWWASENKWVVRERWAGAFQA